MSNKVRIIIFDGPSGVGKGTIIKKLLGQHGDRFHFSISHTTRQPRHNEVEGRDYFFITKEQFDENLSNGEYIEHVTGATNTFYGLPKSQVIYGGEKDLICLLDITAEGVLAVKTHGYECKALFLMPPSQEILEQRLKNRGTETEDSFKRRVEHGKNEIKFMEAGMFDKVIVNESLEECYSAVKSWIEEVTGTKL